MNDTNNQTPVPANRPNIQQQQRGRRRNRSRYGTQLSEKQQLKEIYGIREEQLRRYYKEAQKATAQTGQVLVELLERRLDNALYRAGWAPTRKSARQMASHKLVTVNGRVINIPSIRLKKDDVVAVKDSKRSKEVFANFEKKLQNAALPSWIQLDPKGYAFKVVDTPSVEEAAVGVDIRAVVELFAR